MHGQMTGVAPRTTTYKEKVRGWMRGKVKNELVWK